MNINTSIMDALQGKPSKERLGLLLALAQQVRKEQVENELGPVLEQFSPKEQSALNDILVRLAKEHIMKARDEQRAITLRDLQILETLSADEFTTLILGAVNFIASQDKIPLLDTDTFLNATGMSTPRLRVATRLLLSFYLSVDLLASMKESNLEIFAPAKIPIAEFLKVYTPDSDQSKNISALSYLRKDISLQDADLITARTHVVDTVKQHIEQVHAELGKTLSLRSSAAKAWTRLGTKAATIGILWVMLADVQLPSLDWFRNTSKDMAKNSIEQVYVRHETDIKRLTQAQFSSMSQEQFEQERGKLIQAIQEMRKQFNDNIEDVRGVVVTPQDNVNAEIEKLFKNERVIAGLRDIASRGITMLGGLFDKEYEWKKTAIEQKISYETDVQQTIEKIFRDKDFLLALEKDKKSGTIQIRIAQNKFDKYVDKGLYWTKMSTAEAAIWAVKEGFIALSTVTKDIFLEAFNYIYGSLFGNEKKVDEAKMYFGTLAAIAGGTFMLLIYLLCATGPWWYTYYRVLRPIIKWTVKSSQMLFTIYISGAAKDVLLLSGNIKLEHMAVVSDLKFDVKSKSRLFVKEWMGI